MSCMTVFGCFVVGKICPLLSFPVINFLFPVTNRYNHVFNSENKTKEFKTVVQTCGQLYEKWRREKKFRNLPEGYLTFNITYTDTHKDSTSITKKFSGPVALTLHGAPGSCRDFNQLSSYLYNRGIRTVSPSLPSFEHHRPGTFKHSDEERAEFVKDFLKTISLSHVDIVICHSSSVYAGLNLCLDKDGPVIKSMAMLNSPTYTTKIKALTGFKLLQKMVKASEVPVLLKIMKVVFPFVLKAIGIPVRSDNLLDPLLSATVMLRGNIPRAKEKFLRLSAMNFPMLYAFSEDDKLVDYQRSLELVNLLGASYSDIWLYDKDGNLKQKGQEMPALKVMCFEKGSHYVFFKHPDIIHEAIADFIIKQCK